MSGFMVAFEYQPGRITYHSSLRHRRLRAARRWAQRLNNTQRRRGDRTGRWVVRDVAGRS